MITWRTYYLLFFLYRLGYSILGEVVVRRLTILGDADEFQGGGVFSLSVPAIGGDLVFLYRNVATQIARIIGSVLSLVTGGNEILINMGFQSIAFVGLYKLLSALPGNLRGIAAFLLLLPSFNLWTSIASKESIAVFALGVMCAFIVKLYRGAGRFGWLEFVAAVTLILFKPHYMAAVLFIIGVTMIAKRVRQASLVAMVAGVAGIIPIYLMRDFFDKWSFRIPKFFAQIGSTRESFWTDKYDVFSRAPRGMFQSFYGPTIDEASVGLLPFFSFWESAALVVILLVLIIRNLPTIPLYMALTATFGSAWILFLTYPQGVMNPGAAIRYRSGYIVFIVVIVAAFTSRELYAAWRQGGSKSNEFGWSSE